MSRRQTDGRGRLDLQTDPWIPGLRVASRDATALAARLRLDVHRPCTTCGELTWLRGRELAAYKNGTPLLCAPCVGDAFVEMLHREATPESHA